MTDSRKWLTVTNNQIGVFNKHSVLVLPEWHLRTQQHLEPQLD
jgi:hypothetical protein